MAIVSDPSITGGGRRAIVPADVLKDRRLSRSARWLFSLLCSHANKESLCILRLKNIAADEQVSVRSVQDWMRELEDAGRVVRHEVAGKSDVYRVIRDPAAVPAARADNAVALEARKKAFTPPKRASKPAVDNPVRDGVDAAETGEGGGEPQCTTLVKQGAPPGGTVVQHGSPPPKQESTREVQQLSAADLGKTAPGGGDGRARQGGEGGDSRRAKPPDRRQAALLMPIEGGKTADEASERSPQGPDPGLERLLRLIMATAQRLLSLNREGQLTEAQIDSAFREIASDEGTAAAEEGTR